VLGGALAALACVGSARPAAPASRAVSPARPDPDQIALSLFLIGDTGKPAPAGEPVLISLRRDLELAGDRAVVVVLGDLVYPAGLPAPGTSKRAEMERRLDAQLDAVRDTGARVLFIPGNHDWERGGRHGRDAVRREAQHVALHGAPEALFLPRDGCPGPELVDASERLRLVVLDTQWWLEGSRDLSGCPQASEPAVLDALHDALAGAAGRDVVVVAHHPPLSGGPHGGHFTLRQHLFPLTEAKRGLWLPLPVVGSLYPLARMAGMSTQDESSLEYQRMRDALVRAVAGLPLVAWAAGHEHALQVIESPRFGRVLVSGAGVYDHESDVAAVAGSLFDSERAGYQRIDFLLAGGRRLGVIEVAADGSSREAFARAIEPLAAAR
jgi:hypothetical protein